MEILALIALSEYFNGQIDSSFAHFEHVEKYFFEDNINYNKGMKYYYIDWSLYIYYNSIGNTNKAQKYLAAAFDHIPEDKKFTVHRKLKELKL